MTCREYPPPYEEAMFGPDNMANSRASISVISTMATPTGSRRGSRSSQGCLGGREHFIILFPRMHIYMAYACAIVNFILPGIGKFYLHKPGCLIMSWMFQMVHGVNMFL